MQALLNQTLIERLSALDEQTRRRTTFAVSGYALSIAAAVALCLYSPFSLSRVGSVLLVVAFAQMIFKVRRAARPVLFANHQASQWEVDLEGLDAQIRLLESAMHNLPFLVGVNLFFMGLPGTGSPVAKAWLDCLFLLVTVLLFAGACVSHQQLVRHQLAPLREEVETFLKASA